MLKKVRCNFTLIAAKATVWLLVLSILLSSLPIPIGIVSINLSEDGQAFPCQGGHCGCKTALQCWTNCCCHTPAERVAWAEEHHVAIPEYAQHLHKIANTEKTVSTNRSCCQKQAELATKPACCTAKVAPPAKPACCTAKASPTKQFSDKQLSGKRTKVILSMFAVGCRGSSGELANLPWAIVHLSLTEPMSLGLLEHCRSIFDIEGLDQFYVPELPPPRLS